MSADIAQLSTVLSRLEAATTRLEALAKGNVASAAAPSANTSSAGGSSHPSIAAFQDLLDGFLTPFVQKSESIGGLVKDQVQVLVQAFESQKKLIEIASASKKPDQTTLQDLIKPLQSHIVKITELKEKNRPSPLFFHLSTVADGVPALGWVVVEPTPGPYVNEMKDAAQFYANRVIKENKDKDPSQVEWANAYIALLAELFQYVKKWHTTGLAWNPRGGDAKSAQTSSSTSTPAAPASAPAPTTTPAAAPVKPAALFGDLNKDNLTSGLRKVDKSEMTHKNPELRAAGVVKAADVPASNPAEKVAKVGGTAPKAPPKLELQGSKWVVENHVNNPEVVIPNADLKQVVYVYNCQNSTIKISGKVNAVTLDNCKKCGFLADSVVSSIDIVNSKSVQLQITGKVPTVAIDKTDGIQLYLSKDALGVEIFTAKSSELNVLIPDEKMEGDYTEKPIPEQFKTVIKNGAVFTEAVEHKG